MSTDDLVLLFGTIVAAIALVFVVRARHRSHADEQRAKADDVVCEHLRPAWALLESRGHRPIRVGQRHPDLPMEIHISPGFDPDALLAELELPEPVFVSERGVLYCREDWCEMHPVG